MRRVRVRYLFCLVFTFGLGCTKSVPTFDVLDSNAIPQPLFGGNTSTTVMASSDFVTFSITGQCDYRIRELVAEVTGSTTFSKAALSDLAVGTPTVDCQKTGAFSFTLKSLSDLGFTTEEGKTYQVQLRGVTVGGVSHASTIKIRYATPNGNGPKGFVLTSGGTESNHSTQSNAGRSVSSSYRADIRVDHRGNGKISGTNVDDTSLIQTSTHFKAKIGAAATADVQ